MYEGPEFRHLQYFVAVAEECHFGKAAERLHVSQPALSHQIKQFEEGLDTVLFFRERKGATLTPEGRALLPLAREILKLRAHVVTSIAHRNAEAGPPLRFGYSPFVDHNIVSEALTGYGELVPKGKLQPHSESWDRLVAMVQEGQLDAALVTLPVHRKNLIIQEICEEEALICLHRDDPMAVHQTLPREVVSDRFRVIFDRSHHPLFYDKLMRKFDKEGIEIHPTEFVSAPSEMQYLIQMGYGFGLVLESARLSPDLTTRRIEGVTLKVTTALVWLRTNERPALPLLGFRMSTHCKKNAIADGRKRPPMRAMELPFEEHHLVG